MNDRGRAALHSAMTRLADGDRAAAREVFDALWPLVRAFAERAVRDRALAEDVAQEALVRVFEQLGRYDPARDAVAWALEITAWQCRTALRRRMRAKESALPAGVAEEASEAPAADARLETRQAADALEAAMAQLGEGDRQTLEVLLREGTPPVSGATWRKRKERAVTRLRLAWRGIHGDD